MRHDASMWGRVKKIEQRFARPKEPDQDCGLSGWKEWPGAQRTCTRTWRTRCRQTFLLSTIFFQVSQVSQVSQVLHAVPHYGTFDPCMILCDDL